MGTPALDRMKQARAEGSQVIGEFVEWLADQGYCICHQPPNQHRPDEEWWPLNKPTEVLIADFFEIDLVAVENERRAILASLQQQGA